MTFDEVIWTDKMRAIFADDAPVIHLCGAMGTSKTLVAGLLFFDRVMNAPANVNQFAIIGVSSVLVKRNFVDKADGLYNIHRGLCTPFSDGDKDAAGSHFCIYGKTGKKIVYIAGADNKSSFTNILSLDLGGILLDELSVLHPDVWREAYGRVQRLAYRGWLITTTNGGNPSQGFYGELVNHATVMFRDTVPKIELDEMVEDRSDEHYYHFNLHDDCPHKTAEQTERLFNSYPVGSFYYYSKILGCRGYAEGAAFASLMDKTVHIVPFEKVDVGSIREIDVFIDVGSNRNPEEADKASTVASLVGYSKNCQRVIVLEAWMIPATSHDAIIMEAEKHIEPWWVKWMFKMRSIVIDSAEAILINTWRSKNKFNTMNVKGSVKSFRDVITLRTRCEAKQQLLMQNRLLWTDRALESYNAHTRLVMDEDGAVLDNGVRDNDYNDSLDYAITEKWNDITRNIAR